VAEDVIIVHAGKDREIAAKIASRLRDYGLNVWIDPESLVQGRTPVASVIQSTRAARIILYLCSQATSTVRWSQGEYSAMLFHSAIRSNLTIIPVIIESCEVPSFLATIHSIDLTQGSFDDHLARLAEELERRLKKRTVFICHSSQDKDRTAPIVKALRRRPKLAVWYDDDSLKPGSIIRRGIEAGIEEADYLIAILSTHAVDSIDGWIGFELDQAYEREKRRNLKGHYFVIPVLIEPEVKFPGWLSTKVHVDLTKGFDSGIRAIVGSVTAEIPAE
jgi:hypothetical protein